MPTLNRYNADNEKDGYYILANVGGESPITLQVSWIASRIFEAVGYEDGDAVPTELVWTMYSLDMLYTITSIDLGSDTPEVNPGKILDKLDLENELSQEERAEVISYLEAYTGPDEDRINELREELLEDISEDSLEVNSQSAGTWFEDRHQLPETKDEVAALLEEWTGPELAERAEIALLLNEEFVTWSVRTFAAHPKLADQPIVRIGNEEIVYELDLPESKKEVTIADCRGHDRTVFGHSSPTEYDYRIRRTLFDGTKEIGHIKGDLVVSYESHDGDRGSGTMLKYDLEDILPPHRSYFGNSEDGPYEANYLQEEFLQYSKSEIRERFHEPSDDAEDTVDFESDRTRELVDSGKVSEELAEAAEELSGVSIHMVIDMSNNGNPKLDIDGDTIVITANIQADVGDLVAIREHREFRNNMTVDTAVRANRIPTDSPKEWIKSKF